MEELRRDHWLIRISKLNNSKVSSIIQLSLAEFWIWRIETGLIGEHDGSSRVYPLSDNIRLSNQILAQQRKIELPFYKGEFGRREKTRMLRRTRDHVWSRIENSVYFHQTKFDRLIWPISRLFLNKSSVVISVSSIFLWIYSCLISECMVCLTG